MTARSASPVTWWNSAGRSVQVLVDLRAGPRSATVWTNDLTYDYVRENAEYAT